MRTHSDDKPFKCEHCNISFGQRFQLVIHTRKHTGERTYVCDVCSRAFASKDSLRVHSEIHKKEQKASFNNHTWNDT